MENARVKMYITPKELKKFWPQNEVIYTIEQYSVDGRIWRDSVTLLSREYINAMKNKFNCIEHDWKLFYRSKNECKEAIEILESLLVLNELTR